VMDRFIPLISFVNLYSLDRLSFIFFYFLDNSSVYAFAAVLNFLC
jgi:hypothetical protein